MRFAISFLAFLLFICSLNLKQVLGERTLRLTAYACEANDKLCGVEVYAESIEENGPYKNELGVVTRLIVNTKWIKDKNNPNSISVSEAAQVPTTWTGECLGKFCVALLKDPNSRPVLKMSYHRPMLDPTKFDEYSSRNRIDYIIKNDSSPAYSVSILPLIPKLSYSCDREKKECSISSSAYGAPPFRYTIPFDTTNGKLMGFTTNHFANGMSACIQGYCTFVHKNRSDVRANFDVNHYANIVPYKLIPNPKYEIDYETLIKSSLETQVIITPVKEGEKITQLKCTYDRPAKPNEIPVGPLTAVIDIPINVKNRHLQPILRFKAKNGVGACAGYACCFKLSKDNKKLYKNKVVFHKYHPRYSWAKTLEHTDDLDLETAD